MRSTLAWLAVVAGLALPAPAPAQSGAADPPPEALVQGWLDQLYGGDSVGIWRTEWAGGELVYGVARRWNLGKPEVFLHIFTPVRFDEMNYLLRERPDARMELLYYRSPKLFSRGAKTARVMPTTVPPPLERLPFVEGLPALVDVKPPDVADFTFTRLPDARVANRPCRVVEGRPRSAELGFDRVRFSLANETGVALETVWFAGDEILRRVVIEPGDVADYDGRYVAKRFSVERLASATQIYTLSSLRIDPAFPDVLFTTQNLKLGHFPSQ